MSSCHFVTTPLLKLSLSLSHILFHYGHELILQTWIILLYFRKKLFVLFPKIPLMLITRLKSFIYWSFPILFVSNRKVFVGFLPDVFNEMFSMTNQVLLYNTRYSNTFYLLPSRTNIIRFIFFIIKISGSTIFHFLTS